LIVTSSGICNTELKRKLALTINANIALSNENRLLKEDMKDHKLKFTIQSNITEIEIEKKEVWKEAYREEIKKSSLEKLSALFFTIVGIIIAHLTG